MQSSRQRKRVNFVRKPQKGGRPSILGSGDMMVKRMSLPLAGIVTSASGVLPVTTYVSGLVQSSPATEWASFAARYQQYRVRKITLVTKASHPTSDTVLTEHCTIYASDFIGSSTPSSAAQVLADERNSQFSSAKDWSKVASWDRNPNARLWNPTSASVPVANEFGIAIASNFLTPLAAAGVQILSPALIFEVEFRGSQ